MSKTISFQLDDKIYELLQKISERDGIPIERLAIEWMAKYGPKPVPIRTPEEKRKAREELLKFAGIHKRGDPHGSDNERIDVDLAAEYLNTHDPEH
jgi:hypothetical protein